MLVIRLSQRGHAHRITNMDGALQTLRVFLHVEDEHRIHAASEVVHRQGVEVDILGFGVVVGLSLFKLLPKSWPVHRTFEKATEGGDLLAPDLGPRVDQASSRPLEHPGDELVREAPAGHPRGDGGDDVLSVARGYSGVDVRV
jgi:hypothetical protein